MVATRERITVANAASRGTPNEVRPRISPPSVTPMPPRDRQHADEQRDRHVDEQQFVECQRVAERRTKTPRASANTSSAVKFPPNSMTKRRGIAILAGRRRPPRRSCGSDPGRGDEGGQRRRSPPWQVRSARSPRSSVSSRSTECREALSDHQDSVSSSLRHRRRSMPADTLGRRASKSSDPSVHHAGTSARRQREWLTGCASGRASSACVDVSAAGCAPNVVRRSNR